MICTLTARRLTPGSYEQFRAAWDPAGTTAINHGGWTRIYHCQDIADPDIVISFGLFDGTREQLREAQQQIGRDSQIDRIHPHVREVLLDGSYEVIDTLSKE
jgi:hypothetical protein